MKFLRKILLVLLVCSVWFKANSELQGDGSQGTPYLIMAKADLHELAILVNRGDTFEGKYLKMKQDIDLLLEIWTPIGISTSQFLGFFDGNGCKIKNLKVAQGVDFQGLFGFVGKKGRVANIVTEGVDLIVSGTSASVVAFNFGLVENCFNKINITGTGSNVGGVVGYSLGVVKNCYNSGNISSLNRIVGGVVGYNYENGTTENCYNIGDVSGLDYVGGITGYSIGTNIGKNVRNSYSLISAKQTVNGLGRADNQKLVVGAGQGFDPQTCLVKTVEQMQSLDFVGILNNGQHLHQGNTKAWFADAHIPINNGFPVLFFENGREVMTIIYEPNYTIIEKATMQHALKGSVISLNANPFSILSSIFHSWNNAIGGTGEISYRNMQENVTVSDVVLYAQWNDDANVPVFTAQPIGSQKIIYGGESSLSISVTPNFGHVQIFQWYKNNENSVTTGEIIPGAINSYYIIPTNTEARITYFYCVVTAVRESNNKRASTTSNIATVLMDKAHLTATVNVLNKSYDGDTVATISNVIFTGLQNRDVLTLNIDYTISANFINPNVGREKEVTGEIKLLETDKANNYILDPTILNRAEIYVETLNVKILNQSEQYSKKEPIVSSALGTFTITSGNLIKDDDLQILLSKPVGSIIGDYRLSGVSGNTNYHIIWSNGVFSITPKVLKIVDYAINDKIYDSTTSATFIKTPQFSGLIENENVNLDVNPPVFVDKNVGDIKNIILNFSLSGSDVANYSLQIPANVSAKISKLDTIISGISSENKFYDGTATANILGTGIISTKILGDDVTVVNGSANFESAEIGTHINVIFSSFSLTGNDAKNYNLASQPATIQADIIKKISVKFYANGASGNAPEEIFISGNTEFTLPSEMDLTRDGWTFLGWNSHENGRGKIYLENSKTIIEENCSFYADWFEGLGGTEDTSVIPYKVKTIDDMFRIQAHVAVGNKLFARDESGNHREFLLQNDLDFNGQEFLPIGSEIHPFDSFFNGNNYKVMNIKITQPEMNNVGIFGYLTLLSGVESLEVRNATINGKDNVGIIAGFTYGPIQYCSVLSGSVNGKNNIGGIVGNCRARVSNNTINYVYNCATVSGENNIGGIFGYAEDNVGLGLIYNTGNIACSVVDGCLGTIGGNIDGHFFSESNVFGLIDAEQKIDGIEQDPKKIYGKKTTENINAVFKTTNEMKSTSFISELNDEFNKIYEYDVANYNKGFPVFKWQNDATPGYYRLTFARGVDATDETGIGLYKKEDKILISTKETLNGSSFISWSSSDGGFFEDENATSTTFIMPENDVILQPLYGEPVSVSPQNLSVTSNAGTKSIVLSCKKSTGISWHVESKDPDLTTNLSESDINSNESSILEISYPANLLENIKIMKFKIAFNSNFKPIEVVITQDAYNPLLDEDGDKIIYNLSSGWNLISLPFSEVDLSPLKAVVNEFFVWKDYDTSYQVFEEIEPLVGFWVYLENATIIELSGKKLDPQIKNLKSGWSCYGTSITKLPPTTFDIIYDWENLTDSYSEIPKEKGALSQGKAYWFFAAEPINMEL